MLVSQAHSHTQQARLAITLAWVAGYTNIVTVISCGTVISHVTGSVSQWGREVAHGQWAAVGFLTYLLATFLLGAMLSAICTESGRRRGWESIYVLPMAVQALLLAGFAIGIELHDYQSVESGLMLYVLTGLASMAMGLQNATITRISGGVVRTTHMTGVFTDLGLESVHYFYDRHDRKRNRQPTSPGTAPASPTARRLMLLGSIAGSFALGAGLGAVAFGRFPHWAMFPPVLFLLWIIYHDLRVPICEIEDSGLGGIAKELALPEPVAVYHLRKDSIRRGPSHRLPDLLRWWERLPPTKQIVILDVGEITVLDENAALELHALMKRSIARHQTLIVAGITPAQYRLLRSVDTDGIMDPSNVCADLELAIARGLGMLYHRQMHPINASLQ